MNSEAKLTMMREGKIPQTLLKLGLPTMVGMIVSALYSVVDAYFVGGLGDSQMGAISIVFPIVQLMIGLGMMFGSGAGASISRLLGKGDRDEADRTASTALLTALSAGAVAIAASLICLNGLLTTLGATQTMLPYAREYALIYIPGARFNIFNVCLNYLVGAEGRTKLNLSAMLLGCGLNIVLDPLFIYPLGMGVAGAAWATVAAQAVTFVMYLGYILARMGVLRCSLRLVTCSGTIYMETLSIGVPIFLYQVVASLSMALTNAAVKPYGDPAIAAMGAVVRIMTLGSYVVFGFLKGFQPFAGFNYGARQYARVRRAIRLCLVWSTAFCVAVAIALFAFSEPIVALFAKEGGEMVRIGVAALRANATAFVLFGYQMVYMTLFLAIGKAKQGGLLSISRQGLCFVPLILLLPRLFGLEGVIWTQPAADVLTAALTLAFAAGESKRLNALCAGAQSVRES